MCLREVVSQAVVRSWRWLWWWFPWPDTNVTDPGNYQAEQGLLLPLQVSEPPKLLFRCRLLPLDSFLHRSSHRILEPALPSYQELTCTTP